MENSNDMLMSKNGLRYVLPQTLSTTVNRTFKKEYAQRSQYGPGDTMVWDWNTGTSFVDPQNAMLSMNITVTADNADGTTTIGFGTGSAANLIEEIRIISKSGTELDRIQNSNVLTKLISDWQYSTDGRKYLEMSLLGISFAAPADNTTLHCVIPMKLISGFFRPVVRDMLIPAGLASGIRIEITLAQPERALTIGGAGDTVAYTISDPEMLLMLHDLNDSTQAIIMSTSADNGLEYTYPSYFATSVNTAQTTINESVKKAVSFATRVFTAVYPIDGGANVNDETNDGFASIVATQLRQYQYRVGSSYYPQNPVTQPLDAWYVASSTFMKNRDTDIANSVALADYIENKFIVGAPLQTHDKFNLSGLPINNSSVLELRLQLAVGGVREVLIFMEYIATARTFINKTDIKI